MTQPIQPHQPGNVVPDLSRLRLLRKSDGDLAQTGSAAAESQPHDAADVSASLAKVKSLLAELDKASNEAAQSGGAGESARQKVDQIIESIDAVVAGAKSGAAGAGIPGYTFANVNDGVRKFSVQHADLGPSGSLDVLVEVTQSAQQAAQFLSFGGFLDLAEATNEFAIEIAGNGGGLQFTFASGTAIADFVAAVNSFTDQLGVRATQQGNGVRLESTEIGGNEYVSVRIVDDGGWEGSEQAGIYQMRDRNALAPDPSTRVAFGDRAASEPSIDHGQDVQGLVNGVRAIGRGFILNVNDPSLRARIALSTTNGSVNAQRLGHFTAFTVVQSEGSAASSLARDVRSSLGLE